MKWQRYVWTAIIIAIWVISLMIVDSAAKQTRMGYQQRNLRIQQQNLAEVNSRLKCELSVLHDLQKAEEFSDANQMTNPDDENLIIAGIENGTE